MIRLTGRMYGFVNSEAYTYAAHFVLRLIFDLIDDHKMSGGIVDC